MAIVTFTLSEEGVAVLQSALTCINKFSDDVSLEARKDKLVLTALNLSKSAYVSFTFAANRFFSRYTYDGSGPYRERFYCSLYIRALLSVFRSRTGGDPSRDRDRETAVERCDVAIDDGAGKKSRLVAKVVCRNGVTATHGLPFEVKPPTHAKFDRNEAIHHWTISSRTLRQLMDHFGPGIELLDINTDGDNVVNFTCFTEKAINVNNPAVLKKPLHTSIAVEMDEFDDIEVGDKLHIIISVKDFRAILHHANATSGELSAAYSNPGRPMKLSYHGDGILSEFTLMTVGEKSDTAQRVNKGRANGAKAAGAGGLEAASRSASVTAHDPPQPLKPAPRDIPPPASARQNVPRPSQFEIRPSNMPPPPTLRSESLFVPQDDDDQWEPVNPDEDEGERDNARLEWDASNQPNPSTMRISDHYNTQGQAPDDQPDPNPSGLEPTQRLSDVRRFGLWSS